MKKVLTSLIVVVMLIAVALLVAIKTRLTKSLIAQKH